MASVLISGTHPLPHLDKMGEYDAGDRDDDDDDGDGDRDDDDDESSLMMTMMMVMVMMICVRPFMRNL